MIDGLVNIFLIFSHMHLFLISYVKQVNDEWKDRNWILKEKKSGGIRDLKEEEEKERGKEEGLKEWLKPRTRSTIYNNH